jgi:hypothetical protein
MARRDCSWLLAFALAGCATALAGCATTGYSPYPLDLEHKLPPDAFERCRAVLLNRYGTLTQADPIGFRLETGWQPVADPVGERRAAVFRDASHQDSLAVVVELRRLSVPIVGVPHWTAPRGDDQAERELAELLRESLRDPEAPVVGKADAASKTAAPR